MRPSSVFTKLIGMWDSPTWNSDGTYDGQGSGHTMWGTEWHPSHGFTGNADGGRTRNGDDYRQT